MNKVRRTLTATILSISLLTVMAGAAIAPALGIIKEHFSDSPSILIQFIISMPALFVIVTNLAFPWLCRLMKTRTMAITGLLLYVICGVVPFVLENILAILTFRALLGVSVGMIMPLSTGLLANNAHRIELKGDSRRRKNKNNLTFAEAHHNHLYVKNA